MNPYPIVSCHREKLLQGQIRTLDNLGDSTQWPYSWSTIEAVALNIKSRLHGKKKEDDILEVIPRVALQQNDEEKPFFASASSKLSGMLNRKKRKRKKLPP